MAIAQISNQKMIDQNEVLKALRPEIISLFDTLREELSQTLDVALQVNPNLVIKRDNLNKAAKELSEQLASVYSQAELMVQKKLDGNRKYKGKSDDFAALEKYRNERAEKIRQYGTFDKKGRFTLNRQEDIKDFVKDLKVYEDANRQFNKLLAEMQKNDPNFKYKRDKNDIDLSKLIPDYKLDGSVTANAEAMAKAVGDIYKNALDKELATVKAERDEVMSQYNQDLMLKAQRAKGVNAASAAERSAKAKDDLVKAEASERKSEKELQSLIQGKLDDYKKLDAEYNELYNKDKLDKSEKDRLTELRNELEKLHPILKQARELMKEFGLEVDGFDEKNLKDALDYKGLKASASFGKFEAEALRTAKADTESARQESISAERSISELKDLLTSFKDIPEFKNTIGDIAQGYVDASIAELQRENTELKQKLSDLETRISTFESIDVQTRNDGLNGVARSIDNNSPKRDNLHRENNLHGGWNPPSGGNPPNGGNPPSGGSPNNPPDFTEFNNALKTSANSVNRFGQAVSSAANGLKGLGQSTPNNVQHNADVPNTSNNNIQNLEHDVELRKQSADAATEVTSAEEKQVEVSTRDLELQARIEESQTTQTKAIKDRAAAQQEAFQQEQAMYQASLKNRRDQSKNIQNTVSMMRDAGLGLQADINQQQQRQSNQSNQQAAVDAINLSQAVAVQERMTAEVERTTEAIFGEARARIAAREAAEAEANAAREANEQSTFKSAEESASVLEKLANKQFTSDKNKLVKAVNEAAKLQKSIYELKATRDTTGLQGKDTVSLNNMESELERLMGIINDLKKVLPITGEVGEALDKLSRTAKASAEGYKAAVEDYKKSTLLEEALEKEKSQLKDIQELESLNSKISSLQAKQQTTGLTPTQEDNLATYTDRVQELTASLGNLDEAAKTSTKVKDAIAHMRKSGEEDLTSLKRVVDAFNKSFAFVGQLSGGSESDIREYVEKYIQDINGKNLKEIKGEGLKNGIAKFSTEFTTAEGAVKRLNLELNTTDNTLRGVVKVGKETGNFFTELADTIHNRWKQFIGYLSTQFTVWRLWGILKQGISVVKELDSAFVELKRISHDSASALEDFRKSQFDLAHDVGSTASTIINAAAEWEHLGYNVKDAAELAKTSAVYKNIADGMTSDSEATEDLVSILKAYKLEAKDAMDVTDALIATSNNYAVTAADVGNILKRSSAALAMGGNTFEETVAMGTAMSEVLQSAEVAGSSLKVLSLRLRSSKTELEELGEETDNLVTSTPKLQQKIKALTKGFDILSSDGKTIKSTYEIMKGIAAVWDDMSDVNQAALLELIAGKTRAQGVSALLSNWKQVDEVLNTIADDEGTALRNNEEKLNTINGRITQLTNASQRLAQDAFNTEFIKDFISAGTGAVNLLDAIIKKIGTIPTLVGAIGAASTFTKGGGQPKTGLTTYKATDIVRGNTKQVFHMF